MESTSWSARISASSAATHCANRSRSTPSPGVRPCRMLNVASFMGNQLPTYRSKATAVRMSQDDLREALKRAASALKADGPPFALAGSYALWVHGGPEPSHDVDFVVAEED